MFVNLNFAVTNTVNYYIKADVYNEVSQKDNKGEERFLPEDENKWYWKIKWNSKGKIITVKAK